MATLKEGDNAPNFSLTDNEGKFHSLNDYSGKKLIIFFYPRANTPGCTAEACNLRDYFKDLKDKGYSILGVSADSEKSQQSFSKKYDFYYDIDLNTIVKPNIYGEIKIYNPSSQKYTIILFIKALWITFNGEINSTDYVYYKNNGAIS